MTPATRAKAARLLADGSVQPDSAPAQHFRVRGSTGHYVVSISAHSQLCTCEARGNDCSHIRACVDWVLAEGSKRDEYHAALAARKTRDAVAADEIFARLA